MNKIATRLAEISKRGGLRRLADVGAVDMAARTVEISFSSEAAEVPRWFGLETLSHAPGACDLSRMNDGAAVLWMHDMTDQRGVVEPSSAVIEADRVGRCLVRFSRSPAGEQLLQDVNDKIITKVSVGYFVNGMRLVETRADDVDVYSITAWMPYEVSFVSVPADASVGVGRAAEIGLEVVDEPPVQTEPVIEKTQRAEATKKMDEIERAAAVAAANATAAGAQQGTESERTRSKTILDMGREYRHVDLAAQFVTEGKSVEEFQRALLIEGAKHANKPLDEQVRSAEIGLTPGEAKNFSFLRAVRAQLPGASDVDRKAAGFELECSRAAEKAYGKTARGILIPADILNQRTFSTTTPVGGAGSNIVATELLAGSFIDMLRKRAWVMRRATTMGGLVGNIDIPRQKGATTAYWVGEGGAPAGSDPALDQVPFTPKTVAALNEITRRLMMQSTPDAETMVRTDLLKVMALEIDRAAIYGSGTANQPQGLAGISGINAVPFAVAGKPTYAELVAMETAIALDDADVDSMSYSFNAGIRGYAKTALKFPDAAGTGTIWESGKTVNGYETNVSNQLASGDTFFGNWSDLVVAMWGGLDLTVDPYSLSASGGVRIVAFQDIDINVRHVESFCYGK